MRNWKVIFKWFMVILLVTVAFFTLRIYIKHVVEVKTFRMYKESTEKTELALEAGIQRIKIQTGDHEIYAHWLSNSQKSPSIFILEGNGENLSDWVETQLYLKGMGYNSFVFDYAGFGSSTGKPSVEDLDKDAIAAWKKFYDLSAESEYRLALGHSLGAAVLLSSVHLYDPAPNKIILHAPFSSARDIAVHLGTADPDWVWLIPDVWNNKSNIKEISLPTCIIHSKSDEKTPYRMSQEIAESNPSAKLLLLENYLHNDLFKKPSSTLWTQILTCN